MKRLILLGILLFVTLSSFGQSSFKPILTGEFMYDYYKNPISYLYYDLIILQNPYKQNTFDTLYSIAIRDFSEKPDTVKYTFINSEEVMLIRKNGNIRLFRVLKKSTDYVLLCKENKSLCDCKASMSIYFINTDELKNVEKPFSLSLRKNLLQRLNEHGVSLDGIDTSGQLCSLLKSL